MDLEESITNYKTIIIGRSAVGKSTLLLRYVDGAYNPQKPTIGIDYRFKKVQHQGTAFNLQLWDSAGQQRYRTIVYNYFNLSKAAVVVFDLTNADSLNDAKTWLQQLVMHCGNDIPKLLLGNKRDLLPGASLQQQLDSMAPQLEELKHEYRCQFFAVSALTGQGVNEAFSHLVGQLFAENKMGQEVVVERKANSRSGVNLSEMRKQQRQSELSVKNKNNSGGKCC